MKSIYVVLIAILSNTIPITAQSQVEPNRVTYQCEKEQSLQVTFLAQSNVYPDGAAAVTFPDGKTLTLPQVISGSGARYSDGKTTFWTKGEGGFVEVNDKVTIDNCVAVSKDASSSSTLTPNQNLQGTRWMLVRWGTESAPKTPLKNTAISAEFSTDQISGQGGCNRYNGGYQIQNGKLSITPIASTRKACPPEIMNQEAAYFANLEKAENYQINAQGQLEISYQTEREAEVMVFEPKSGESQPIRGLG